MARVTIAELNSKIVSKDMEIEKLLKEAEEKDSKIKSLNKHVNYYKGCYKNENIKHIMARHQRDIFRDQRNRAQEEWAIVVAEMKTDTQLANQNRNLCSGDEAVQ